MNLNANEELIQRAAWRLVRSAHDRMGTGRGAEKLMWCVSRLTKEFQKTNGEAEDYIRAAYVNFKTEMKAIS